MWCDTGSGSARVPALPGILFLLREQDHRMERHFARATYNESDAADHHLWRDRGGVARRHRAAGRPDRADRRPVRGDRWAAGAPSRARPGPGPGRRGGGDRRRRPLHQRRAEPGRPGGTARAVGVGGVDRDDLAGPCRDRWRDAGRDPAGPGGGTGPGLAGPWRADRVRAARLPGGRAADLADGARSGRDAGDGALGQGRCQGQFQGRVRLSLARRVAGQHRRGAGRGAAAGQRRQQHRHRPPAGARAGAEPVAGPVAGQADPGPRGRRRLLPRTDPLPFRAGAGVLDRLPGHRQRPGGDQAGVGLGVAGRVQRRRGPA